MMGKKSGCNYIGLEYIEFLTEDINSLEDLKGKSVALEEGVVDDFLLTVVQFTLCESLKSTNWDYRYQNKITVHTF